MSDFKYIIIGGGMTGSAALKGIRELDPEGSIAIFSAEKDPPYSRPPLTKGLWKGKPFEKIFRRVDYPNTHLFLGKEIERLESSSKQITDNQGISYSYDKLLLATGGTPRKLPFEGERIIYYRTLQDYRLLRKMVETRQQFVVIGGGFIGSEIAAALTQQGKEITLIFPEEGICWEVIPPDLSAFVTDYYREHGVNVLAGDEVVNIREKSGQLSVVTKKNDGIHANGVVVGVGLIPNVKLAESAGIDLDGGILVDQYLRTNKPEIYAAGDVAVFYNPDLNARIRVEHEDNANTMGFMAGQNMAGAENRYTHLPMFYSDLFDLGYEAVGQIDPKLEVIYDWVELNRKGVVYYLRDRLVRGVLLWNIFGKIDAAREMIARHEIVDPIHLRGLLTKDP